jgi:hypothetical protein
MDLRSPTTSPPTRTRGDRRVVDEAETVIRGRRSCVGHVRGTASPAPAGARRGPVRVGWVSRGALDGDLPTAAVPPADAYGVATFYALIATEPRPGRVAHVCDDVGCAAVRRRGADRRPDRLARWRRADGTGRWHRSPCLGQCDRAPAVYLQRAGVDDRVVGRRRGGGPRRAGSRRLDTPRDDAPAGEPGCRLLRRIGVVDPPTSTTSAGSAASTPCARRWRWDPRRSDAVRRGLRRSGWCGVPDGVKWDGGRRGPRGAAPPDLQRRRVRARHVQGPGADGGRPVRAGRGDGDRRHGHRQRAGLPLHPWRVPGSRPRGCSTRSRWRGAAAASATTCWAPDGVRHRDPTRAGRLHLR